MTDKADIIVWEKNTETNEVKSISLKAVVGLLNTQNSIEFNDLPLEYYVNRKDIKWNIAKDHFVILMIQRIGNEDQKETK